MKSQIAIAFLAAASANALAMGNAARDVEVLTDSEFSLSDDVMNSAAFQPFQHTKVLALTSSSSEEKRQNVVTPDNIFVLQCTEAGFREPCLVFGAPPGQCGE